MKPENKQFIALVNAAGWTPAEAARRLDLGRSSTSRFMSGEITPSPPVLKLLKLILATEMPGALTAAHALHEESLTPWEREIIEELRPLRLEDRNRVIDVMRTMIKGLPKGGQGVTYTSSSDVKQKSASLLKKASAALHGRGGDRSP
jgi:transcriptional regulator with XRE-family HTH domain